MDSKIQCEDRSMVLEESRAVSRGKKVNVQGIGIFAKKAGFNGKRQTYLNRDGFYTYKYLDGSRVTIPVTSDTIDFIILLDEMDHAEDLQDKNVPVDIYTSFDDIQDAVDGTRLEEVSISHAKMAAIEDPESDVFEQAFPEEPEPPTEEERIVMEVVSKSPDRWQNYYHDVYGGTCKNQEEYRRREVQETGEEKSLAAISKMDTKLKERVCEALGKPMPPKKRGRKG